MFIFLLITAIKVSKFTSLSQKHIIPTIHHQIPTTKMDEIMCWPEPVNFDTLLDVIRKK